MTAATEIARVAADRHRWGTRHRHEWDTRHRHQWAVAIAAVLPE